MSEEIKTPKINPTRDLAAAAADLTRELRQRQADAKAEIPVTKPLTPYLAACVRQHKL